MAELIEKHAQREYDIVDELEELEYEHQEKLEAIADNLNGLSEAAGLEITFAADSVTEPSLWQIFKDGILSAFKSVVKRLRV